jgi:hypothetical protein
MAREDACAPQSVSLSKMCCDAVAPEPTLLDEPLDQRHVSGVRVIQMRAKEPLECDVPRIFWGAHSSRVCLFGVPPKRSLARPRAIRGSLFSQEAPRDLKRWARTPNVAREDACAPQCVSLSEMCCDGGADSYRRRTRALPRMSPCGTSKQRHTSETLDADRLRSSGFSRPRRHFLPG